MRSFTACTIHQILLSDGTKTHKVGGTCTAHGRNDKRGQTFGQKT